MWLGRGKFASFAMRHSILNIFNKKSLSHSYLSLVLLYLTVVLTQYYNNMLMGVPEGQTGIGLM
jgi:hypothetical protein